MYLEQKSRVRQSADQKQWNHLIFSAPEPKAQVHYCDHALVMGDRLNFIIDHQLESVDSFDAILPIIIGSQIFSE